jgi:ATP-binding cassette, subfamily B, bacterial
MDSRLWRDDFPESKNPLKFFWFASKPHLKWIVTPAIAVTIASTLSASIAYAFKLIADAAASLNAGGSYVDLLHAAFLYIGLALSAELIWRISGFAGAVWANNARATARHALTAYVTLHSRAYFSDRFAGSLNSKIAHAANGMREMVEQMLWQFLELFVAVVASFVITFIVNHTVAYIFLAWVLTVVILNVFLAQKRLPIVRQLHTIETRLTGVTVDLLSNISTMQEYARRLFEMERIKAVIQERRNIGVKNWWFGESMLTINGVVQAVFAGLMVFVAVRFAEQGVVSVGDIILIITIIFRIQNYMLVVGRNFNTFGEKWGEIEESLEEILEPHEIPDKQGATPLTVEKGEIVFDRVCFQYGTATVFRNLSLRIAPGQRVGLVGRSGAGKSTLMRLLLHHHDLTEGAITIDGTDIAGVTQESLRHAIGVVPQEPLLFHRTVTENIAYGRPEATKDEIIEAAMKAQAHEFIERMPRKYKSMVGERGIKLSGGERQRIAIARAILKNAPILLLDEATSALDSESEVAIQNALEELMKGKTVIAIAHRLSTLREMDRIIVLDKGDVVEDGTHNELVAAGGIYAELWSHQIGGFMTDR